MSQKLNPASKWIVSNTGDLLLILIPILVILEIFMTYIFMRRYIHKHESKSWASIKPMLIISLIPLLALINFWHRGLLTIEAEPSMALFKTVVTIFLSTLIFGICLRYKNKFSWQLTQQFLLIAFLSFLASAAILYLYRILAEFILRQDPAYVDLVRKIEEKLRSSKS